MATPHLALDHQCGHLFLVGNRLSLRHGFVERPLTLQPLLMHYSLLTSHSMRLFAGSAAPRTLARFGLATQEMSLRWGTALHS